MQIIVLLIGISLAIAVIFLVIFRWNMTSGQYDDTYTPSVRMLFDDKPASQKAGEKAGNKKEISDPDQTQKT